MKYTALVHYHTPKWDMVKRWSAVGIFEASNEQAAKERAEELKRYWILSGFPQLSNRYSSLTPPIVDTYGELEVAFVAKVVASETAKDSFEVFTQKA